MKRKRVSRSAPVSTPEDSQQAIDALYGLEPVFEPDASIAGSDALSQFVLLSCPYCGEQFETRVDLTNGAGAYVEDCQVCCQPIEVAIELNDDASLQRVRARRLD